MAAHVSELDTMYECARATRVVDGWSHVDHPGFYVSAATGHGFRVAPELLLHGGAPAVELPGAEGDRFVWISDDPCISTMAAKLLCVDSDIVPRF